MNEVRDADGHIIEPHMWRWFVYEDFMIQYAEIADIRNNWNINDARIAVCLRPPFSRPLYYRSADCFMISDRAIEELRRRITKTSKFEIHEEIRRLEI